jgi:threonine aldolase
LASGLADLGWEVNRPETNIVLASAPDVGLMISSLAQVGVRAVPMAGKVRFITHRDVSASDVAEALERIAKLQA